MFHREFWKNPYHQLNISFAAILFMFFLYSAYYSSDETYLFPSACGDVPDELCPSRGLQRCFSELVRLHFEKAAQFNPYGIRLAVFFMIQLVMRIATSVLLFRLTFSNKTLVVSDTIISIFYFFYAFYPFISLKI